MRFRFQMEGLFRVRRLLEQQARERLDESMSRVRRLEHSLTDASKWVRQTEQTRMESAGLPAAELQYIDSVLRQTQRAMVTCEHQKHAEEQKSSKLRAAYLTARQGRETIETLRENALLQFNREQSRREQSTLDESFLAKLVHSRNAEKPDAKINPEALDDRNLT